MEKDYNKNISILKLLNTFKECNGNIIVQLSFIISKIDLFMPLTIEK